MYIGLFDSPMWWSFVTRITHSRHRKLFFAFAILQCVIQVSLRAVVLGEDAFAISITHTVLKTLNPSDPLREAFPVIQNGALLGCNRPDTPDRICWTIVEPKGSHGPEKSKVSTAITLKVVDRVAAQSTTCKQAMILPHFIFQDGEREDTTLMLFQVWLFILGVTGLLQDSIPHMAANLGGQIMNTAWAAFRISSLLKWRGIYIDTVVNGACGGADALAATWGRRIVESSVVLTSNAILLVFTAYLTIRLIMSFMEATYDRVGASPQIARAHKWALAYSMSLHGGFFIIASLALWISRIAPAPVRNVMFCSEVYLAVASVAIVLVPVWMLIGWRSVCIECGRRFAAFSVFSCILLGTFSFMFASPVFKSIVALFPFFGAVTVAAFVLLFAATILGLICRFHFGRGLAHFLEVQAILARENFASASFSYGGSVHGSERPGSWDPEKKVQITPDDDAGSLYSELGIAKKPIFLLRGDKERMRQSFVPINVPITDREQGLPAERFMHPGLTAPPRAVFNPAARRTNGLPSGPAAHLRPVPIHLNPADRMSSISTASNGTFGKTSVHNKRMTKIQAPAPVGQDSFLKM